MGKLPKQIPLCDAIAELENLTDECQQLIKPYLWNDGGVLHVFELTAKTEQLKSCKLIEIRELDIDAEQTIASAYRGKDLVEICGRHGIQAPERMSKKRLVNWCVENAKSCFISFTFAAEYKKCLNGVFRYLRRKFDWDETIHNKYPWGSRQRDGSITLTVSADGVTATSASDWDNRYYFPDDEITELLTLYGHNRCLGGFEALPQESEE